MDVSAPTTPGGAWAAPNLDPDDFLAVHGSLAPTQHNRPPIHPGFETLYYNDLRDILGGGNGTPNVAAQTLLNTAGWTGVTSPVSIWQLTRNSTTSVVFGSWKHVIMT